VERRLLRPEALAINARAALWEVLVMGPVAILAWQVRRRWRKPVLAVVPDAKARRR
jgi:hypothetical protein